MWRSGIQVIADWHTKMLNSKLRALFTFRRFFHLNIGGFFKVIEHKRCGWHILSELYCTPIATEVQHLRNQRV